MADFVSTFDLNVRADNAVQQIGTFYRVYAETINKILASTGTLPVIDIPADLSNLQNIAELMERIGVLDDSLKSGALKELFEGANIPIALPNLERYLKQVDAFSTAVGSEAVNIPFQISDQSAADIRKKLFDLFSELGGVDFADLTPELQEQTRSTTETLYNLVASFSGVDVATAVLDKSFVDVVSTIETVIQALIRAQDEMRAFDALGASATKADFVTTDLIVTGIEAQNTSALGGLPDEVPGPVSQTLIEGARGFDEFNASVKPVPDLLTDAARAAIQYAKSTQDGVLRQQKLAAALATANKQFQATEKTTESLTKKVAGTVSANAAVNKRITDALETVKAQEAEFTAAAAFLRSEITNISQSLLTGGLDAADGALKIKELENALAILEDGADSASKEVRVLKQSLDDANISRAEKLLESTADLSKESRVTTYLDRAFNAFSENSSTLGQVLQSEVFNSFSDIFDLVGGFPEVVGQVRKASGVLGAFALQLTDAVKPLGVVRDAIRDTLLGGIIEGMTETERIALDAKASLLALGGVLGVFAAAGLAFAAISGSINEANTRIQEAYKQVIKQNDLFSESLRKGGKTLADVTQELDDLEIAQKFRLNSIAVADAYKQLGTDFNGFTQSVEGVSGPMFALARTLSSPFGENLDKLRDTAVDAAYEIDALNVILESGVPLANSLTEILGDYNDVLREIDGSTSLADIVDGLLAGDSFESLTTARDRFQAQYDEESQRVTDLTQQIYDLTQARAQEQLEAAEDARIAQERADELARANDYYDRATAQLEGYYDALEESIAATERFEELQGRLVDLYDRLQEQLVSEQDRLNDQLQSNDEKRADILKAYQEGELSALDKYTRDRLRRLEDFEREKAEIERKYYLDRFEAFLDNDIAGFLEAQRREQEDLAKLAIDKNVDDDLRRSDFESAADERRKAFEERLAEIAKERDELIAASAERRQKLREDFDKSTQDAIDSYNDREAKRVAAEQRAEERRTAIAAVESERRTRIQEIEDRYDALATTVQANRSRQQHEARIKELTDELKQAVINRDTASAALKNIEQLAGQVERASDQLRNSVIDLVDTVNNNALSALGLLDDKMLLIAESSGLATTSILRLNSELLTLATNGTLGSAVGAATRAGADPVFLARLLEAYARTGDRALFDTLIRELEYWLGSSSPFLYSIYGLIGPTAPNSPSAPTLPVPPAPSLPPPIPPTGSGPSFMGGSSPRVTVDFDGAQISIGDEMELEVVATRLATEVFNIFSSGVEYARAQTIP